MLVPIRDHNPRVRFPVVTVWLVVINAAVFLLERLLLTGVGQHGLVLRAGAIPAEIVHRLDLPPDNLLPVPGAIWTSMFLHGGWLHLIGNMWFLWLFGDNIEDALGRVRYVAFYLLAGTVGALAQCFSMPDSTVPMIGASGAVAGVLGGYVMLYPRARIVTFVAIPFLWHFRDVPAWFFLGVWFVSQFFIGAGSGVAWMAHVGGFLAGLGAVRLLAGRGAVARRHLGEAEVEYLPPPRR